MWISKKLYKAIMQELDNMAMRNAEIDSKVHAVADHLGMRITRPLQGNPWVLTPKSDLPGTGMGLGQAASLLPSGRVGKKR